MQLNMEVFVTVMRAASGLVFGLLLITLNGSALRLAGWFLKKEHIKVGVSDPLALWIAPAGALTQKLLDLQSSAAQSERNCSDYPLSDILWT